MTAAAKKSPPNLMFSHFGLSVKDIGKMEKFYTDGLGFTVTDRGEAAGMQLVFISRDPYDHHQIVLATGRPDNIPPNTAHPQFGPSINQISFRVGSLAELKALRERLEAEGGSDFFPANHGIAWSIYAHDPEGNNLEFFVDSDWYVKQPFLIPLDLSKSDAEIIAETKTLCESSQGYTSNEEWRAKIRPLMSPFVAPTSVH